MSIAGIIYDGIKDQKGQKTYPESPKQENCGAKTSLVVKSFPVYISATHEGLINLEHSTGAQLSIGSSQTATGCTAGASTPKGKWYEGSDVRLLPDCAHPAFTSASPTERQVFLATWKDIPNENELQFQIKECHLNAGE